MINNFNFIIFKLVLLKKTFKYLSFYNKIKTINFDKISFSHFKKKPIIFNPFNFSANFKFTYFQPFFSAILFYNLYVYAYLLKNKKILYNKIYLNFFNKKDFNFNSLIYNLNVNNSVHFYKNLNEFFKKVKPPKARFKFKRNFKKLNVKIKFFKVKKKKEFSKIPLSFINVLSNLKQKNNSFKKFNKNSLYIYKLNSFLIDSIYFNSKKNNTQPLEINYNLKIIKNSKIVDLFDILTFYKNLTKSFKIKKKIFVKKRYFYSNKPINFSKYLIKYSRIRFSFSRTIKKFDFSNLKNKCKTLFSLYHVKYTTYFNNYFFFFLLNKNSYNFINFFKKIKKSKNKANLNNNYLYTKAIIKVFKYIIYLNDVFEFNNFNINKNLLFSNVFFKNLTVLGNLDLGKSSFKLFDDSLSRNKNLKYYNNYYPIFYSHKNSYKLFMSKFKSSLNIDFAIFMNFYIVSFLENFFKKRIFLKISNNFFNKPPRFNSLKRLHNDYKNLKFSYMKQFSLKDFFEIIWYSFFLKDLSLLSEWFCKFMESVNFKFHKKFITFFQNFIHKNQTFFFNCFNIRGFFFDIRGKVGVTGNSKKRHHFFKIGSINKSTKIKKINFKQSVIRTPSGALGVTMILNF